MKPILIHLQFLRIVLGGDPRDFKLCFSNCVFCCCILNLEGFGCMGNTPTGRANDLPTMLAIFKSDPKSRSVNNLLQQLDLDPNSITNLFDQPKLRPEFPRTVFSSQVASR
jgi:hypothetical protein